MKGRFLLIILAILHCHYVQATIKKATMKTLQLTLSTFLIMLLAGCKNLEQFVNSAVNKPTVSYQSFSIDTGSNGNIIFKPVFLVTNKNAFSVPVDQFSYQLSFNGANMLDGRSSQIGSLPAFGHREITLDIPLNTEVLASFKELLVNNQKLDYSIKGDVSMLGFRLPFEKNDTVYRPTFSLGAMEVKNGSFNSVNLGLKLTVDNPNDFSIPVPHIAYSVKSRNQHLFDGKLENSVIATGNNTIEIPLTLRPGELFNNAFSLLSNPNIPLAIDIDSGIYKNTINYDLNLKGLL